MRVGGGLVPASRNVPAVTDSSEMRDWAEQTRCPGPQRRYRVDRCGRVDGLVHGRIEIGEAFDAKEFRFLHPALPASFTTMINLNRERFGEEREVAGMLTLSVVGEAGCFEA